MSNLKVKISHGYTDYLDVEIKTEEDVAQAVTAAVTKLLAEASAIINYIEVKGEQSK
jgi:hypothetical protein